MLDEPTASLDQEATDMLFARVPQDPEELADMLATPQDGPRLLEIQVR